MKQAADPREKMANQLLMRGHANATEILTASFGEWPPRGLDIVDSSTKQVELLSIKDLDKIGMGFFGKVMSSFLYLGATLPSLSMPKIMLNSFRLNTVRNMFGKNSDLNPTLGHENIHVLQMEVAGGDRMRLTGKRVRSAAPEFMLSLVNTLDCAKSLDAINALDAIKQTKRKEPGPLSRMLNAIFGPEELSNQDKYLRQGMEIQARVHEVLMSGYPTWPKLPQTREELSAAMIAGGVEPPADVATQLAGSPGFREAQKKFTKCDKSMAANELNLALESFQSKQARNAFWTDGLPVVYGELIELYGDIPGRARMGLGSNPRAPWLVLGKMLDGANNTGQEVDGQLVREKAKNFDAQTNARLIMNWCQWNSDPSPAAFGILRGISALPNVKTAILAAEAEWGSSGMAATINKVLSPEAGTPATKAPQQRQRLKV